MLRFRGRRNALDDIFSSNFIDNVREDEESLDSVRAIIVINPRKHNLRKGSSRDHSDIAIPMGVGYTQAWIAKNYVVVDLSAGPCLSVTRRPMKVP